MTNNYNYTIKHLILALDKAGLKVSRMWVYRQEEKGNLILPKSTTNFKKPRGNRKLGAVRMFTLEQIEAIVQAFLPDGKGYFNYKETIDSWEEVNR